MSRGKSKWAAFRPPIVLFVPCGRSSVSSRWGGNFFPGGHPLVPRHAAQPQHVVVHPQIAVVAANDCLGPDRLHFLRHHADIDLVAPIVAEAIVAEAISEMAQEPDVVFQLDVGATKRRTGVLLRSLLVLPRKLVHRLFAVRPVGTIGVVGRAATVMAAI